MSREHLYKAKRVNWWELPKEEWWVEGYYVKHGSRHWIYTGEIQYMYYPVCADLPTKYEVEEETVCEYTGLTDKNGRKIFENDIVNCREYECCGYVAWNEEEAGFYFLVLLEDGRYEEELLYDYTDELEVIGNIFDNSELLKGDGEE